MNILFASIIALLLLSRGVYSLISNATMQAAASSYRAGFVPLVTFHMTGQAVNHSLVGGGREYLLEVCGGEGGYTLFKEDAGEAKFITAATARCCCCWFAMACKRFMRGGGGREV